VIVNNILADVTPAALPTTGADRVVIHAAQTSGINGLLRLMDSSISADLTALPAGVNTMYRNEGMQAQITNCNMQLVSGPESETVGVDTRGSKVDVFGGTLNLTVVNSAPAQNLTFYLTSSGLLTVNGNTATVLETILTAAQVAAINAGYNSVLVANLPNGLYLSQDGRLLSQGLLMEAAGTGLVYYTRAITTGFATHVDCTVDLQSSFTLNRVLADVQDVGANVTLQSIKSRFTFVPQLTGIIQNILYFAQSEQGNMIASGGLYTNVVHVSKEILGNDTENYYVQDNDSTIVVEDTAVVINLEDPIVVSQEVLYRGKQVIILNRSSGPVDVVGSSLIDGNTTVDPGKSKMFQNDGIHWFVIMVSA